MNWNSKLFTAGFAAIAATPADQWLRGIAQGSGVILTFHRVRPRRMECFAPNRFLEVTPDFLDRVIALLDQDGFDVVPLDEVPARLETKQRHRPFAAITFERCKAAKSASHQVILLHTALVSEPAVLCRDRGACRTNSRSS